MPDLSTTRKTAQPVPAASSEPIWDSIASDDRRIQEHCATHLAALNDDIILAGHSKEKAAAVITTCQRIAKRSAIDAGSGLQWCKLSAKQLGADLGGTHRATILNHLAIAKDPDIGLLIEGRDPQDKRSVWHRLDWQSIIPRMRHHAATARIPPFPLFHRCDAPPTSESVAQCDQSDPQPVAPRGRLPLEEEKYIYNPPPPTSLSFESVAPRDPSRDIAPRIADLPGTDPLALRATLEQVTQSTDKIAQNVIALHHDFKEFTANFESLTRHHQARPKQSTAKPIGPEWERCFELLGRAGVSATKPIAEGDWKPAEIIAFLERCESLANEANGNWPFTNKLIYTHLTTARPGSFPEGNKLYNPAYLAARIPAKSTAAAADRHASTYRENEPEIKATREQVERQREQEFGPTLTAMLPAELAELDRIVITNDFERKMLASNPNCYLIRQKRLAELERRAQEIQ